jgi:hypothetical protein
MRPVISDERSQQLTVNSQSAAFAERTPLFNFVLKPINMKLYTTIYIMVTVSMFSCGNTKQEAHEHHEEETDQSDWKEMDEFHLIMAETFHPYKDSSNLEPAKTRVGELATAADRWASASLPEKVNNDEIKSKLQQLRSETETLTESVRTDDDNVIGEQLTKVHDTFHEIQEAWYGGH